MFCLSAWVGSLSIAACQGCGPFAGSLLNRFGCRRVSIGGCLTCAISLTIASFANGLAILYVCYGVLGAGISCVFLSSLEIVRKCFDKWRSIALGITSAGVGLGTMVLSQILQSLVSSLSWRSSLRIVACCLALNSFFGLLYDSKIDTASISEMHTSEEAGQGRTSKRFTFHCSVWKVPGFLVLTLLFSFVMFGRATVFVHLVSTRMFLHCSGCWIVQFLEGNGYEARQTSKEKTKTPRFMLKDPRPCTIFCFVHTLCMNYVTKTFSSLSSSVQSKQK